MAAKMVDETVDEMAAMLAVWLVGEKAARLGA